MQETRRGFFKILLAGVASLPVLLGASRDGRISRAFGQTPPSKPVSADDPMAKQLGYVADTSKVDKAANPNHTPEQTCGNCILCLKSGLKVEGQEGDWCHCGVIQTGLVSIKGWCKSYAKKV